MCQFGDGLLGEEREALVNAGRALIKLGMADPASMSREDLAEVVVAIAAVGERSAVMAGRYMDIGERTAASLTKGEKSMVSLVSARSHLSKRRASQMLRAGSIEHRFPHFHQALMAGKITTGHTDVVVRAARSCDSHQLAAAEKALAALAVLCTPEEFAQKLALWLAVADPTEHLDEFLRAQARRHFVWGKDLFGNIHFGGTFEPLAGEAIVDAVQNRQKELERLDPELRGSAAAHDALADLILGDAAPKAVIEIIYPQSSEQAGLDCAAATSAHSAIPVPEYRDVSFGSVIYPQTARGTLVPPAVVDQVRGRRRFHPVDLDGNLANDRPAGRHFTTVQKRMVRLRDNGCQHPGCRTSHRWAEYDHRHPYECGGPTTVRNGQLLCRFHHRWKHRGDRHGSRVFDDSPVRLE